MNKKNLQFYFLLVLLAVALVLSALIFQPFFGAFIMAGVFAVIFRPLYKTMLRYSANREGLSAFCTALIVVILVVVPILFLGAQIFQEAGHLYDSIANNGGRDGIISALKSLADSLEKFFPSFQGFSLDINQYLKETFSLLLGHLGGVFSSVAKIITSSFIFLIALYYLLKDGKKLKRAIVLLSPLPDTDDEMIFKKLSLAVSSVVKGNLAIACIQGVLTGAGFAFFGVPNAVLWGTVTAIAALIPAIGTALVLIPAILFLFLSRQIMPAIGLLVWGVAAVGLIDNFLAPRLIGHGMELHPLIVFISVLGGIIFFGPLGFILGPLTVSLLFALFDIYAHAIP